MDEQKEDLRVEPLLQEPSRKSLLFDDRDTKVLESYYKHACRAWLVFDIDFSQDRQDWKALKKEDKMKGMKQCHFILNVLTFFAVSDEIVGENIQMNFGDEIKNRQVHYFYVAQEARELVHSDTYKAMLEHLLGDRSAAEELESRIASIPAIKKKIAWVKKWMDPSTQRFAKRLIAFCFIEGVFFSGSFCAMYWLKDRNMFPGLTTANEWIATDEKEHTDFAVLLYREYIARKLTQKEVEEILGEAVAIEKEFICDSLQCDLIGINKRSMSQYIEYVADDILCQLGFKPMYGRTKNPFPWMVKMFTDTKANFFEKRVSQYAKQNSYMKRITLAETPDDDTKDGEGPLTQPDLSVVDWEKEDF